MSRLTRQEMKRDEVLESVGRTVSFVRDHTRTLLSLIAAVIVAVLLVVLYLGYKSRQVTEANRLLARALQVQSAPIDALSPDPDDVDDPTFADEGSRGARAEELFTEVYESAKGTAIGGVAAAYLGDLAASAGDLDRAESLWREAVEVSSDSLLAGKAQMSLLNLTRSRGDAEAVISELRSLQASESTALSEDVVLFELGKALEDAGRPEEARANYDRLLEDHATSPFAQDARERLAGL